MDEYIKREDAISYIKDNQCKRCSDIGLCGKCAVLTAVKLFETIPAADVRPVVFCRDCKWCHAGYCEKYDDLIPFGCANKPWEEWFCADGKKREER